MYLLLPIAKGISQPDFQPLRSASILGLFSDTSQGGIRELLTV